MKNFINHIFQIQFQQFLRLSFMVTCQSSELDWEVTVELPANFLSLGRRYVNRNIMHATKGLFVSQYEPFVSRYKTISISRGILQYNGVYRGITNARGEESILRYFLNPQWLAS